MNVYNGFAISQPGYSHQVKELPCQDAADCEVGDDYAIAAVSDGHGGERYFRSDVGAKLAVEMAIRLLHLFLKNYRDSLKNVDERDKRLQFVAGEIINKWRSEIEKHFTAYPLNETERKICAQYDISPDTFQPYFYGATLLYTCMTPHYSFASQIGDGACVFLFTDRNPEIPDSLKDQRLGFGVTTSLSDSNAIENFYHHFRDTSVGLPKAVFLYTDGIVDSYEKNSFLMEFNKTVYFKINENKEITEKQLQEWLPIMSERGSRDDVSMAGVYQKKIQPVGEHYALDDFFTKLI